MCTLHSRQHTIHAYYNIFADNYWYCVAVMVHPHLFLFLFIGMLISFFRVTEGFEALLHTQQSPNEQRVLGAPANGTVLSNESLQNGTNSHQPRPPTPHDDGDIYSMCMVVWSWSRVDQ